MTRTGRSATSRSHTPNGQGAYPSAVPTFATLDMGQPSMLAKAFAAIGRRTKSLLSAPAADSTGHGGASLQNGSNFQPNGLDGARTRKAPVLQLAAPERLPSNESKTVEKETDADRLAAREAFLSTIAGMLRGRRTPSSASGAIPPDGSESESA